MGAGPHGQIPHRGAQIRRQLRRRGKRLDALAPLPIARRFRLDLDLGAAMAKRLVLVAQPHGRESLHRPGHRPFSGVRHGLGLHGPLALGEQLPCARVQRVAFGAPGSVRGQHRRHATPCARFAMEHRPCPAVRVDPPEQGSHATPALEVRPMAIRQILEEALPRLRHVRVLGERLGTAHGLCVTPHAQGHRVLALRRLPQALPLALERAHCGRRRVSARRATRCLPDCFERSPGLSGVGLQRFHQLLGVVGEQHEALARAAHLHVERALGGQRAVTGVEHSDRRAAGAAPARRAR